VRLLNMMMWIGNAAPPHPNLTGLDLHGKVLGQVRMRVPIYGGRWFAVVTYKIPYADGRPPLAVYDQLVPYHAIDPYLAERGQRHRHRGLIASADPVVALH
jgi:hypothetical protein